MNEIEKQFFETFGIEKKQTDWRPIWINGVIGDYDKIYAYPQITDSMLLELTCILGSIFISVQDKETLKDHILNQCIMNKDAIKQQVQALFKENN